MFHLYNNLGEYLSFSPRSYFKLLLKLCEDYWKKTPTCDDVHCWEDIPIDILELIVERLTISDRLRLSLVCKYWQSVAMDRRIATAVQVPWLASPIDKDVMMAYDMQEGKFHKLVLPKVLSGAVELGCSKGWLTLAKKAAWHNQETQLFLFNPISRIVHQLPPLSTISANVIGRDVCDMIYKLALSSSDASNCVIAILFNAEDDYDDDYDDDNDDEGVLSGEILLALCRIGDKQWSIFNDDKGNKVKGCIDMLFHNGTLCVHYVMGGGGIENHTLKLAEQEVVSLKLIPHVDIEIAGDISVLDDGSWNVRESFFNTYMVQSSNREELLLIYKVNDELSTEFAHGLLDEDELSYFKVNKMKVFKMDVETGNLSELDNLDGLAVFLFYCNSVSISTRDLDGIPGNCIFFLEDCNSGEWVPSTKEDKRIRTLVSRESGIYYLSNGRILRCIPSQPIQPSVRFWFTPMR